jgi:hypothetical protein
MWSLSEIPEDFTGSILQYIITEVNRDEDINNNSWQTIALFIGVTEPVNGSWLQAIVELYEGEEGGGEDYG